MPIDPWTQLFKKKKSVSANACKYFLQIYSCKEKLNYDKKIYRNFMYNLN